LSSARGRWLEVRARVPSGAAADDDARELAGADLADALVEMGGRAVEEREGWLVTHLVEPDDPEAFVSAIGSKLSDRIGLAVEVAFDWREPEDWAEAWKRGLAPRRLTPRLWVTPSWHTAPAGPGEVVVVVDPGMAFGTAEHGTTRGALRLLDGALESGERVLDVGAGSAILGVAAALLGAADVVAVEGDPVAGEYALENIARNGVADRVRWIEAWADPALLRELGPADGVLANIESGVLRRLLPGLWDAVRPGGWVILSGIPAEEWDGFAHDVVHGGFALELVDEDSGWRSGRFRRPAAAEPTRRA
jgi:ribosomal protein L11 methyltransferase